MIRARLFILSPILMVPVTLPTLMVMTAGQGGMMSQHMSTSVPEPF